MKKVEISFLVFVGILLLMTVPSHQTDDLVWTDRGCEAEYSVNETIKIYFEPHSGVEFELWAFDALMNEKLLTSGVGRGDTYFVEKIAQPPLGPLTLVLRMPCGGECELCDMCDYDQCTIYVERNDPCRDHCFNGVKDCEEYGVDCGGGCPITDSDNDGVEDCMDLCPDSRCRSVDEKGCETDTDSDGILDCEDDCPDKKGDPANRGCPRSMSLLIGGGIGGIILLGLIVWRMKSRRSKNS